MVVGERGGELEVGFWGQMTGAGEAWGEAGGRGAQGDGWVGQGETPAGIWA